MPGVALYGPGLPRDVVPWDELQCSDLFTVGIDSRCRFGSTQKKIVGFEKLRREMYPLVIVEVQLQAAGAFLSSSSLASNLRSPS